MKLHMADVLLSRARLFGRRGARETVRQGAGETNNLSRSPHLMVSLSDYPWDSPAADLAAAEKLIHQTGYHRRDEELADAKRAILV